MHPTHTCFDDAAEFCMRNGGTVVHGLIPHAHAWVEHEGKVWQGGLLEGRRCFYAMPLDTLKPLKTSRYPAKLFIALWTQHGYPGPWRADYQAHCNEGQVVLGAHQTTTPVEVIIYDED